MKLDSIKVANSLAITTAIISLICILAVWLAPDAATTIGLYLLHGATTTRITAARSFSFSMTSLLIITIMAWAVGWLFVSIYNPISGDS